MTVGQRNSRLWLPPRFWKGCPASHSRQRAVAAIVPRAKAIGAMISSKQVQVVSCARFQSIELPVVLNILSLVEHLEADLSVACLMLGGVGHS